MLDYNRAPRAKDPTLAEMKESIQSVFYGSEPDEFGIAQAIYWFCVEYHSGMSSNLYAAQCELRYKPAMAESAPEPESLAEEAYYHLVAKFS